MVTIFPANPIGAKFEILLNGVWTDISIYVYMRDVINLTGIGRADWTGSIQASQITLTLNNTGGRFTPNNASSPYFPYIQLNTQLRVSINSESRTLVTYSGYRFWGEVSVWPVAWDPSGHDVYSQIVVSGIWRRLSQQQATVGSPFSNYIKSQSLQAYWSMEDGSGSTAFIAGITGEANGTWVVGPNGPPAFSNDGTSFLGSNSLASPNESRLTFTVPAGGTPTNNVTRFALSVPTAGDSESITFSGGGQLANISTSGTITSVQVNLVGNKLAILGFVGGSQVFSGTIATAVNGIPVLVSVELTPSGSAINWAMRIIKPGGGAVLDQVTGTRASTTIGAITSISVDGQGRINNSTFGQLMVMYSSVPSLITAAYALGGYVGEFAMDRFTRLCAQFGIATETIGVNTSTQAMGPQTDDHLTDLLQMIENTDGGLLYETTDQFGLGYRSMVSMQNQAAAMIMNYATAQVTSPIVPTFDDALIANTVAITAQDGTTYQSQLITGARSILNPPNGAGDGYSFTKNVSVAADSQLSAISIHYLKIGTVNDFRVSSVTLDLTRPEVASLFSSGPSMRIGDYLQITNPPAYWTGSTAKQLVWGWTETISNFTWTITFNTVSELPWETIFNPGTISTKQLPGNSSSSSSSPPTVSGFGIGGGVILPTQISALTASLLGNLGVLNANPYFMGGDGTGWSALNGTFTVVGGLTGAPYAYAGSYTNNGVTAGAMEEGDNSTFGFPVTPGQQVMITGWFNSSVTSIKLGFDFFNAGGSPTTVPTLTVTATVVAATWTQLTTVQTPPAGAAWARPRAGSPNADGSTLLAQAVTCLPQVPGSLVQAGTITAAQIATGTLTAALLVASIVVAGIVDATVVQAAEYIATSGAGQFFAYSTASPSTGGLEASIAGAAGTDGSSNPYPIGIFGQALTLKNQASGPPAFSGASSFYSSTAGRPRYLSQSGSDTILERGAINASQFPVGNVTAATNISSPMSYFASEGAQSSEYEIEIRGNGTSGSTSGTVGGTALTIDFYIDGTVWGGGWTIGGALFNGIWAACSTASFRFSTCFTFTITAGGAGGTAVCTSTGGLVGSTNFQENSTTTMGGIATGSFDCTASHTFQLKSTWGGLSAAQAITTFRTRLTRRD